MALHGFERVGLPCVETETRGGEGPVRPGQAIRSESDTDKRAAAIVCLLSPSRGRLQRSCRFGPVPAARDDGTRPDRSTWWSVDEWTEGRTLAELISREEIPAEAMPRIMRNLAEGLRLLHEAGIIYREMSTQSIIVTDVDKGSVVLTDFELGKLLDGSPTVRGSGPGNPYRAEEVDGKKLTETDTHVDWYSWGRILLHVVTGGLPPKNQEGPCLEQAELPEQVKKIVAKCLSPDPPARPRQADEVLKGISGWR